MIYLDSSVALAYLLGETRRPPDALWSADLVSSALLRYEIWNRVHARGLGAPLREPVQRTLEEVLLVEMSDDVLERLHDPLPLPVRTLDAIHLATMEFMRRLGHEVELASFDARLVRAASAMGFAIADC